jgi:hypothetical protein
LYQSFYALRKLPSYTGISLILEDLAELTTSVAFVAENRQQAAVRFTIGRLVVVLRKKSDSTHGQILVPVDHFYESCHRANNKRYPTANADQKMSLGVPHQKPQVGLTQGKKTPVILNGAC